MFGLFLCTLVYFFQKTFASSSSWEALEVAVAFAWFWYGTWAFFEAMGMLFFRRFLPGKSFFTQGRVLKIVSVFLVLLGVSQTRELMNHFPGGVGLPSGAGWVPMGIFFLGLALKRKSARVLAQEGLGSFFGKAQSPGGFRFQTFQWPPRQSSSQETVRENDQVIEVESTVVSTRGQSKRD